MRPSHLGDAAALVVLPDVRKNYARRVSNFLTALVL
jgi:hypothetical protein